MSDVGRRRKIALLGYTDHKSQAPFLNDDWVLVGINDLYLDLPEISNPKERVVWFQVHEWHEPHRHDDEPHPLNFSLGPAHPRDPNHLAWLQTAAKEIPVYLMEQRPEIPEARYLDRAEMREFFIRWGTEDLANYWTNSVSYMLGWAIRQLTEPVTLPDGRERLVALDGAELGVWGVDMMVAGGEGSEYGYQRPSCEAFLGFASGCGIKVTLPRESDLMKTAAYYGDGKASAFRKKLLMHSKVLQGRVGSYQQQANQAQLAMAELQGGLNVMEWIRHAWMPGDPGVDLVGSVPGPNAHKKSGKLIMAGEDMTPPPQTEEGT